MFTLIEELQFILEPQIRPFCGPLFFARSLESALGSVTANGSFGLLDTSEKKLIVTCHHVWDEFQKAREKDSQLRIFVCLDKNSPVVLNQEPMDENTNLDIATFDIQPLLPACGGRKFYALHQNPPHQVRIGDQLLLVGYPGLLRTATEEGVDLRGGAMRLKFAAWTGSVSTQTFQERKSCLKRSRNRWRGRLAWGNQWQPMLLGSTGPATASRGVCKELLDEIPLVHRCAVLEP